MPGVPNFSQHCDNNLKIANEIIKNQKKTFLIILILILISGIFQLLSNNQKIADIIHLRQTHPDFVERHSYTQQIDKNLKKIKNQLPIVILYGEGGIGKSELAIAYGNKHLKNYSLIHWIDAAKPESLRNSYEILAEDLKLQVTKQDQTQAIVQKVHRYLESYSLKKPWLLIYDNVDQFIRMPERGNGAILITSRNSDLWNLFTCIKVLPLTKTEGKKLLANIIGKKFSSERNHVLEKLDYFPLALNLAAHYIRETPGMTEKDYLELLDKNPLFFIENFSQDERCSSSLITSWKMTLERFYDQEPDVWNCLHFFAYLSPDVIPRKWIEVWLKSRDPQAPPSDLVRRANNTLRFLVNRGLIFYNQKSQTISIHRLKQQCMKFDKNFKASFCEEVLLFLIKNYDQLKYFDRMECLFEYWKEMTLWESSAVYFLQNFDGEGQLANCAKLQTLIGNWKCLKGDYSEAVRLHTTALQINQSLYDQNHSEIAVSLNNLAWSKRKCGELEKAIEYYQRAIAVARTCFGENHLEFTFITNNFSLALIEMGNFEEAKNINLTNLEIRKRHFGLENVNTANSIHNLGWASLKLGQICTAIDYYHQALEIYQKLYGKDHPYVAICNNHLGRAFFENKNYAEARIFLESALEFYAAFYGEDHPKMAVIQNDISKVYEALNMMALAYNAAFRAFEISLQALKTDHPTQTKYFTSLIQLLENPNFSKEKTKLIRNIKKVCIKYLNKNHEFFKILQY